MGSLFWVHIKRFIILKVKPFSEFFKVFGHVSNSLLVISKQL